MKKITVIIDHPDPSPLRFGRVLTEAYTDAAKGAGNEVRVIDIARLDYPLLRSQEEWSGSPAPDGLRAAETDVLWDEHLPIIYPLWLGDVSALLKGFFEQVLRPGRAVSMTAGPFSRKPLSGKSARVVVTMGMPAWIYRWVFGAHLLKSPKSNVLWFVGVGPVRHDIIGMVADKKPGRREAWLARMHDLGGQAR